MDRSCFKSKSAWIQSFYYRNNQTLEKSVHRCGGNVKDSAVVRLCVLWPRNVLSIDTLIRLHTKVLSSPDNSMISSTTKENKIVTVFYYYIINNKYNYSYYTVL